MMWLSADCETPSFAAALVKLALARNRREGDEAVQMVCAAFIVSAHKSMRIIAGVKGGARS